MEAQQGSSDWSQSVKTFALPNASEKGLACCWRYGNKFTIYPHSQSQKKTQLHTPQDQNIFNIRQDIILFSSTLRKLVNESNGTFLSAQKAAASGCNGVELLKISRQYRSVIRVCLQNLQEAIDNAEIESEKADLTSYITIFYTVECVWHLCEILYVDNIPGDVILPFLLEWVRFHFPCHEQPASQILEACERGSESRADYWDTVVGMVVQGRLDVARALLRLHSASEGNEFQLVDNALRTMPKYSVYGGVSASEFTVSWKHWQLDCRAKLSSRSFRTERKLELIMRLIVGEYSAFEEVRGKYESWFDILGGWILYTEPTTKSYELGQHAHACAGMRVNRHTQIKQLDVILLAVMENDLHQVVHEIQNISDNGWFATHLTDLLTHCGKLKILDEHQTNVTNRLRESLILEYGSVLMEHRSLWVVGLSYLASCPEGLCRAELMLERLAVGSEARILKILHEARRYGLHSVVESVCGGRGAACLLRGRPGGALAWALRGRCAALATRTADLLLTEYTATGKLRCEDLLLTLGPAMLISDRLVFLGKYCEFHRLYKNRDFKSAGRLLVSLLTSQITPPYFWGTLLLETLPLLESDEPIFSSAETFELMGSLEYHSEDLDSDKAELLRLALARNLSRTMLHDDSELEND